MSEESELLDLRTYRSFEQTMRAIVHPAESDKPLMNVESAEEYLRYAKRLDAGRVNFRGIQWDKVKVVSDTVKLEEVPVGDPSPCVPRSSFPKCPEDPNLTHELLRKLVVLKLNGGLGTTMGCKGSKSAIEVRDGLNFLDMTIRQVEFLNSKYGVDVPLILMNSFNTHEETVRAASMYNNHNLKIHHFEQHCFPKANKKTFLPVPTEPFSPATKNLWYPPGHGDVYAALADSGLLEQFVKEGKEYVFISNIDNLGATVDLDILYELMCNDWTFCMEVTTRQRQDVTGGILVEYDGKHRILERASMAKVIEKQGSNRSRMMFNTNNIWVGLRNLQSLVSTKALEMEVLIREKPVKVGDAEQVALQLSCASGGAMEFFDKPIAVHVNRQRFLPVKTTSDLFGVQSDLFTVKHGSLTLNPSRVLKPTVPTVKLGPCFQTIEEYQKRLVNGVPDILELEHLTVSGDVHFGKRVTLKGTVIIVAEEGSHIDIASGSLLQDNVITGNLRIMEH